MKSETIKTIVVAILASPLLLLAYSQFTDHFGWHTEPDYTKSYLTKRGYTNIKILPFKMVSACPRSANWYRTRFSATNKEGVNITGSLCGSWIDDGRMLVER